MPDLDHYYRLGFGVTQGEGVSECRTERPAVGKLGSPHAHRVTLQKLAFSLIPDLPELTTTTKAGNERNVPPPQFFNANSIDDPL